MWRVCILTIGTVAKELHVLRLDGWFRLCGVDTGSSQWRGEPRGGGMEGQGRTNGQKGGGYLKTRDMAWNDIGLISAFGKPHRAGRPERV